MRVRLNDCSLVEDLLAHLRRADCVAEPVNDVEAPSGATIAVAIPGAHDDGQARMELELYLKVWEAVHPGANAELLPSEG